MIFRIIITTIFSIWLVNAVAGGLIFILDVNRTAKYNGYYVPLIAQFYAFIVGFISAANPKDGLKYTWDGIHHLFRPDIELELENISNEN